MGLNGSFLGGPFHYGVISYSAGGLIQSAMVTTPGNLLINGGSGGNLTAVINWIEVSTVFSSGGILNSQLQIDLSDVQHTASNPDLLALYSS
jgi:hypothetical protein